MGEVYGSCVFLGIFATHPRALLLHFLQGFYCSCRAQAEIVVPLGPVPQKLPPQEDFSAMTVFACFECAPGRSAIWGPGMPSPGLDQERCGGCRWPTWTISKESTCAGALYTTGRRYPTPALKSFAILRPIAKAGLRRTSPRPAHRPPSPPLSLAG
jgi:hypothetical protein